VAETARLAANSERQAIAAEQLALATKDEAEQRALKEVADAQPLLRPNGGSGSGANLTVMVVNSGATVSQLSVECPSVKSIRIEPSIQLESGQIAALKIEEIRDYPFAFALRNRDRLNVTRQQHY